MSAIERAPTWKRFIATALDIITTFCGGGYVVGALTGGLTDYGFKLSGWPALLLMAGIVAYFYVGRHLAGGTLWDRFFGIGRPQPN